MKFSVVFGLCFTLYFPTLVLSNGHSYVPIGRSSIWRDSNFQNKCEANYNDNTLNCGGFNTYMENGQKCGICGDNYKAPKPRDNEINGTYGCGVIVQEYTAGQIATFISTVTAAHFGYIEYYYFCPPQEKETADEDFFYYDPEDESEMELLQTTDGSYQIPVNATKNYEADYWIPNEPCPHALLLWKYTGGNNWGMCPDGSGSLGCGPQPQWRGCIDCKILPKST